MKDRFPPPGPRLLSAGRQLVAKTFLPRHPLSSSSGAFFASSRPLVAVATAATRPMRAPSSRASSRASRDDIASPAPPSAPGSRGTFSVTAWCVLFSYKRGAALTGVPAAWAVSYWVGGALGRLLAVGWRGRQFPTGRVGGGLLAGSWACVEMSGFWTRQVGKCLAASVPPGP